MWAVSLVCGLLTSQNQPVSPTLAAVNVCWLYKPIWVTSTAGIAIGVHERALIEPIASDLAAICHVQMSSAETFAQCNTVTCVSAPWLGLTVMADGTDGVATAAGRQHHRHFMQRSMALCASHMQARRCCCSTLTAPIQHAAVLCHRVANSDRTVIAVA